ncbi:MAG TPA: SDR family oxidoreductase, partial [Hyphomicrobium sp.]|nr:SDR family oxidoreductase [Hyphomicrobium sp.]
MCINLKTKSVLVTGASRGIGFGIAEAFAEAGAELSILADDETVRDAASRLSKAYGRPIRSFIVDITDKTAVTKAIADISKLDVLVNNAGLELITPVTDPSDEVDATFARIIDINVRGTWNVTRAALPLLKPGARIINTASVWAKSAVGEFAAYIASKHAVVGLTRTFARELGPHGITVNAVCPGWVRTVASVRSAKIMAGRSKRSEAEIFADVISSQCLPGLMEP